jgi:hypothetical protein
MFRGTGSPLKRMSEGFAANTDEPEATKAA